MGSHRKVSGVTRDSFSFSSERKERKADRPGTRREGEARGGADGADGDDCVVGGGAAAVQTRSESRKNQGEDEGMCNHNQGERRTEQDPSLPVTARGQ